MERNQLHREVGQGPPRTGKVDQDLLPVRKVDKGPPRIREGALLPPAKVEGPQPQVEVGGHRLPAKVPHPPPQEVPLIHPAAVRERETVPGPAGIS